MLSEQEKNTGTASYSGPYLYTSTQQMRERGWSLIREAERIEREARFAQSRAAYERNNNRPDRSNAEYPR